MTDDSGTDEIGIQLRGVELGYPVRAPRRRGRRHTASERDDLGSDIVGYGRRHVLVRALRGVSLDVNDGDRLAVLGTNGAGKTTLLRVMAGILAPTAGQRAVQGRLTAIFNLGLGMEVDRSGYDNIMLRGLLEGRSRREMLACIDEIADASGLGDYLDMPLRTYSAGMVARLAFSIGTSGHSPILLMDEWINAGDQNFLELAEQRLSTKMRKVRLLVLSSHNQTIVRQFCNRACVLSHGRLVFDGSVEDGLAFFKQHKRKTGTA